MSVRTVDIADAIQTLAEYARQLDGGRIVVTSGGQLLAAVVLMDDADLETVSLSMDPQFMEIIRHSRTRGEREGGVAADEVERKSGHAQIRPTGDSRSVRRFWRLRPAKMESTTEFSTCNPRY